MMGHVTPEKQQHAVNLRHCAACRERKHLKRFPLLTPDDPLDFRRASLCDACLKAAKRAARDDRRHEALKKEQPTNERLPGEPEGNRPEPA